ncbi:MAG TPA: C25 family cysteine peptidase, partial [Anaerolineaceae bacterium]
AQHWITGPNDDRMWPALSTYNSPRTWSAAILSGPGTARTFSGQVLYETRVFNAPMTGIGGVIVNLVGYDTGGTSSIVASVKSNINGTFTIKSTDSYSRHRLEIDPMGIPKGLSADFPKVSLPGKPISPLVIDWGAAPGTSFGGNNFLFVDQAPRPLDNTLSQHMLIITSQAIANEPKLKYYLNFKEAQGFTVEVATVESIQATSTGASLVEKIRNFEIIRRNVIGPSFKYVLLIGGNSTIPFGSIDGTAPDAGHCISPSWPTDWFYVDLTSNWDTNGNGCFGDGIFGDKAIQKANHYTPDASGSLFNNTISLGRIPIDYPYDAINALLNSMSFEQQNGDFKRNALLASTMMDMKAGPKACWLPPDNLQGGWYTAGDHEINGINYSCGNMSLTGTDGSYLSEAIRAKILSGLGIIPTLLYENGLPLTGASPYKSFTVLTESALRDSIYFNAYGLVQLMGHGNVYGVYRMFWGSDANIDGAVNNPTQPIGSPLKSAYETATPSLATLWSGIGARNGKAPIFVVASCSTGQYDQLDSFGASLLAQGQAVAWVGGTGVVPYSPNWTQPGQGGMQDIAYNVTQLLLTGNYRLGDALWEVMHNYMAKMQTQSKAPWWAQDFDLYGDPTITFYGNGGADAVGAAWPMLRNNSAGLGYTSLTGPVQTKLLWSYPANARVLDTLKPSPLVSSSNDVVASYYNFVDVIRNGVQQAHLTLSAPVFGSPALADDGTLYAVTTGGLLYAFTPSSPEGIYAQRWTLDLGAIPTTSPIIGPDGFVAIGHQHLPNSNLSIVRPDGSLYRDLDLGGGEPVGAIAIGHDRTEYITTSAGGLVSFKPFCGIGYTCSSSVSGPSAYTTPPLLANNSVYAGRADGTVVRYDATTMAPLASFSADEGIVVGPILGPDGQVLVGTQSGNFYSLSIGLTLRWQKFFGTGALNGQPAFTANGLYVANGDSLETYDPASGVRINSQFLATGAGGGTVAAGYNRQMFVQTGQGPIVAVGEGWLPPISHVISVSRLTTDPAGGQKINSILVLWSRYTPPQAAASASATTATGILVQRSILGGAWQDLAVLPLSATQFNDLTIQPGTDYSYRLQVLDSTGNDSDFANTPADVHSYPNLPSTPAISAVTASGATSLHITWSHTLSAADPEVSSYRLERAAALGGTFTAIATLPQASTSFEDMGLATHTPYFYRLFATNSTGDSSPSPTASGTTRSLTLTAPKNLILTNPSGFNYQLSWSGAPAVPGAKAVIEQQVEGQQGFTQIGAVLAAGPFTFDQVNPGYYQYRVKFVAGNTESPYTTTMANANLANFTPNIASKTFLPMVKK